MTDQLRSQNRRHGHTVAEVTAYADQLAELASQVRGWALPDQAVVTVAMTSDGTLIATTDYSDDEAVVRKDVNA